MLVVRVLPVALLGSGLVACGAATPASNTAANAGSDTAVVNLDATHAAAPKAPPAAETGTRTKGEEGKMGEAADASDDPHIARASALRDAAEFGLKGLLDASEGDVGGILGALSGGGSGLGAGGLGLSGIGVGGGGRGEGIGLGSIGTLGHGSGGPGGGYAINPIHGSAINVGSTSVIELGDSASLGVSLEQANRTARDRVYMLRECYEKVLEKDKQATGSVDLRIVIGKDGRVAFTRALASTLRDDEALQCIAKGFKDAYIQVPSSGLFGVFEITVRFRPAPKK